MPKKSDIPSELNGLGKRLFRARLDCGLTQRQLAVRSGIAQPRLSNIEQGLLLPTLRQLLRLARALSLPLQWFLNGSTAPSEEIQDIALELQHLGVSDLFVPNAVVPGAFRPVEHIVALAVAGDRPETRIIEAVPAVLAWNRWSAPLLRAYCRERRSGIRLAWLAEVALTIHHNCKSGFPGGCPQRRELERYVRWWSSHLEQPPRADDLGCPADTEALPPAWKRWNILYASPLDAFHERARHLAAQRQRRLLSEPSTEPGDE